MEIWAFIIWQSENSFCPVILGVKFLDCAHFLFCLSLFFRVTYFKIPH